jgi:cobalt-zinc-cadmium efflux system membrane fusion protein
MHPLSVRTRQWIGIAGTAAVAVSLLSALALATGHKADASPTPSPSPSGAVLLTADQYDGLTTAPASVRPFRDQVMADGRIAVDGDRTVEVYSPYTGVVEKVLVEPGQPVTHGQALFLIRANEAAQSAADLASAEANLTTARAQQTVAEGAYRRAQAAFQTAGGSQKDVEAAERDLIAANGAVTAAETARNAQRDKQAILGLPGGSMPNAGGLVYVRAPADGIVARRAVAPGQRIVDPSQAAMEITDTRSVWLEAQVSEEDSGRISVGQTVDVHVDAFPGRVFAARVLSMAPVLDADTHRLPVSARIDNPDQALKPDMFATVDLYGAVTASALAVPVEAVVREGEAARVWVIESGRRAVMRQVSLGLSDGGYVQIRSGLNPGDRVVVSGALFVDKAGLG